MRTAFQQCDVEFSWTMYKLVCHCVRKLNMHNLDQTFLSPFMDPKLPTEGADQHRKGFWALVLIDLFFRLLHDKPAIITANMAAWRVNLPSINAASELAEHVVPTLTFLVKSRLTFLLLRFFDMLSQNIEDKNSVIDRIEGLCEEIDALFQEWSVVSLSQCLDPSHFSSCSLKPCMLPSNNPILLTGHAKNRPIQWLRTRIMMGSGGCSTT
jgi:hypothetical protein